MSNSILAIGEPRTGKSTSIRNLDPSETFVINVLNKPLPFRGASKSYIQQEGGNYFASDDYSRIIKVMDTINIKRPEITTIIIDDYQYIMGNEFMRRAHEKGFDKFSQIGQMGWMVAEKANHLRNDLDCFVLAHSENDGGFWKTKTIGKMLDDKISLEGMFTIILHSLIIDGQYKFLTNRDDHYLAGSPEGMFEDRYISNDLLYVKQKINTYSNSTNEDIPQ